MRHREFYVALGVPRDADAEAIRPAYRKIVTRYRRALDPDAEWLDDNTEPTLHFRVMRTYSERRHSALFEPEPLAQGNSEVDRFFNGFIPEVEGPTKARRAGKDLYVELRLEPDEARIGGLYPVHIPVIKKCPTCHGAEDNALLCPLCNGSQRVTEDRMIEVVVPPGVTDGQVVHIAMEDVGLEHTDLVCTLVISS